MSSNAVRFKEYIESMGMKADIEERNDKYFCEQFFSIKGGPRLRILSIFSQDDEMVNLYFCDYVKIPDLKNIDKLYKHLNDLNKNYTYFKFYLNDDYEIMADYHLPFKENFNPEVVVELILSTLDVMQKEYPNFMKLIWA